MELRREDEEVGHSQFLCCRSVYLHRYIEGEEQEEEGIAIVGLSCGGVSLTAIGNL